jgi:hypothetical protein
MEIPHDKFISDKEVLTEKYNVWRDELFTRLSQWKQAELEKQRHPTKTIVQQGGRRLSILEVVEARKSLVREARQYMQVLHEMLLAAENGTLENYWSDEELREGLVLDNGVSIQVKKEK